MLDENEQLPKNHTIVCIADDLCIVYCCVHVRNLMPTKEYVEVHETRQCLASLRLYSNYSILTYLISTDEIAFGKKKKLSIYFIPSYRIRCVVCEIVT